MTKTIEPVRIHVYYHDDVSESTRRIVPRNYLKECIAELERIANRKFIMEYRHSIPGVTDMAYRGDSRESLTRWAAISSTYADRNIRASERIQRYLLVTQGTMNDDVLGIAHSYGMHAIASLATYQTIAHELGHTFGMTHEDAELQHNAFGLPCETYGYPNANQQRAKCYQYSPRNRDKMAGFFAARVD